MIRVVGLDLSLSNSGIARFDDGNEIPALSSIKPMLPVPAMGDAEGELERMRATAALIVTAATRGLADDDDVLFVIEGPAQHASHSGKSDERAGLRWLVALNIRRHGRIVMPKPNTVKSFWAHNGSASKKLMLGWAERRYPDLHIVDDNIADALALASMGARHRGIIDPRPPLANETFLTGVRWPE